jgi:hypothetical protein
MGLLINCAFAALVVLAVSRTLGTRPAGPLATLFVCGLCAAMTMLGSWIAVSVRSPGFGLFAAFAFLCILTPLAEEGMRSVCRKHLPDGGATVLPISLVLGGVEALAKASRINLGFAPDYAALDTLAVFALLASVTSILFHANMGLFWDQRAGRHGGAQATYECILLHGAFNTVVLLSEPPTLPDRVVQLAVIIGLHLVCFTLLNAARSARTRTTPGDADLERDVSGGLT